MGSLGKYRLKRLGRLLVKVVLGARALAQEKALRGVWTHLAVTVSRCCGQEDQARPSRLGGEAVTFAGRRPVLGQDPWCVTWKLYTEDGTFPPHDQCLMADAILRQMPVRGVSAVAERPDGTRLNFLPFRPPV